MGMRSLRGAPRVSERHGVLRSGVVGLLQAVVARAQLLNEARFFGHRPRWRRAGAPMSRRGLVRGLAGVGLAVAGLPLLGGCERSPLSSRGEPPPRVYRIGWLAEGLPTSGSVCGWTGVRIHRRSRACARYRRKHCDF